MKQEKQQKREQTYKAIIELKQKQEKKVKKPEPEPEPEEEEEEEEEEKEKLPPPPPKKAIVRRVRPQRREETDEELYSKANIEILRQRLYQQTRQRLNNDLFGY